MQMIIIIICEVNSTMENAARTPVRGKGGTINQANGDSRATIWANTFGLAAITSPLFM
jgi:hypothetical protein